MTAVRPRLCSPCLITHITPPVWSVSFFKLYYPLIPPAKHRFFLFLLLLTNHSTPYSNEDITQREGWLYLRILRLWVWKQRQSWVVAWRPCWSHMWPLTPAGWFAEDISRCTLSHKPELCFNLLIFFFYWHLKQSPHLHKIKFYSASGKSIYLFVNFF